MSFYYFLQDLFQITLDLDGDINTLSSYTVGIEYRLTLQRRKEVMRFRTFTLKKLNQTATSGSPQASEAGLC